MRWLLVLLIAVGMWLASTVVRANPYDHTVRTVVSISMASGGYGSGVVIYSDKDLEFSLIVSNYHVTTNEKWLKVKLDGIDHPATLIKEQENPDLSLLRTEVYTPYVAHMHREATLNPFDELIVVGAGSTRDQVYPRMGMVALPVTKNPRHKDSPDLVLFTGTISSGDSGGALFRKHRMLVEGRGTHRFVDHYELVGIMVYIGLNAGTPTPFGRMPTYNNTMGYAHVMANVRKFVGL